MGHPVVLLALLLLLGLLGPASSFALHVPAQRSRNSRALLQSVAQADPTIAEDKAKAAGSLTSPSTKSQLSASDENVVKLLQLLALSRALAEQRRRDTTEVAPAGGTRSGAGSSSTTGKAPLELNEDREVKPPAPLLNTTTGVNSTTAAAPQTQKANNGSRSDGGKIKNVDVAVNVGVKVNVAPGGQTSCDCDCGDSLADQLMAPFAQAAARLQQASAQLAERAYAAAVGLFEPAAQRLAGGAQAVSSGWQETLSVLQASITTSSPLGRTLQRLNQPAAAGGKPDAPAPKTAHQQQPLIAGLSSSLMDMEVKGSVANTTGGRVEVAVRAGDPADAFQALEAQLYSDVLAGIEVFFPGSSPQQLTQAVELALQDIDVDTVGVAVNVAVDVNVDPLGQKQTCSCACRPGWRV